MEELTSKNTKYVCTDIVQEIMSGFVHYLAFDKIVFSIDITINNEKQGNTTTMARYKYINHYF